MDDSESFPNIPAEGVRFQLKARDSEHFMYSRPGPEPTVSHSPIGGERNDQIFTLIHGRHDRKGLYAIKSWACGNVVFSRFTFSPTVGNISGDGDYPDNWFDFLQDDHDKESFRIYCPTSDSVFFSRIAQEPTFSNFIGDKYSDQLWRFVLVD
ncbi:hypothetical protein JVT61DRAFT_14549 [Boletus reticuloceps]|uniref:Uncharacterized protein n=1 Tax=Boletus reticuloceps TaxID=495285 RepID=A0A8I3AAB6_9AGAM|nr:hypothetical protein JVT61DRAFT_14549 [Boletus reticuloceps]